MYFVYAEVVQGGQSCLYVGIDDWLKISRQWEDGERSTVYNICTEALLHRAQELCESRGGRPGLPVPNSPGGLCGRKATLEEALLLFCLLFVFFFFYFSFFFLLAVIVVVCLCLQMIFALWWTSCITLAHFMGALWSSSTILPVQCVHLLAMSSRG